MLRRPGLLDEAHAAVDLHADRRRLVADVGRERLGDRGQQRGAIGGGRPFARGVAAGGEVERDGGQAADAARRLDVRLHRHQHPLDVGVLDDRAHAVAVGPAALAALPGKSQRLLIGALADRHTLRPDCSRAAFIITNIAARPRFSAPTSQAFAPSVEHDAGRRAVDAELVLDPGAAQVVALAERAIVVDEEFGRQKQGQAARSRRRVGQAGEDQVDDVLGHVVVALGDEDLLAEQAIASVVGAFRPGPRPASMIPNGSRRAWA